jgi:hypothetical protein
MFKPEAAPDEALPPTEREMNDPIKARSDEGLEERQHDPPGLPHQRVVLEGYPVDPVAIDDGGPLDDTARDELDRYAKEGESVNEVGSWDETGKGDLPRDTSSTAKD